MPELPEVETIARGLRGVLAGRRISEVSTPGEHALRYKDHDAARFRSRVQGARILGVGRRGKLLLLDLEPAAAAAPLTMTVHLRMTGRLFIPAPGLGAGCAPELATSPHAHVVFRVDGLEAPLVYHDVRKFGWVLALTAEELAAWPFWATLGPEPLELDAARFAALFRHRKGRIKALLLDQKVIAGIGNIYADESLFRAGIRPDAPADRLGGGALERLHGSLQEVLREAIAACGSSISDYRTASGDAGAFQNSFQVYGRGGECCLRCGEVLQRTTVAGRTSVFCPCCQKT